MTRTEAHSPAHLAALDGLRGIAILLVLPHHLRTISEPFDAVSLAWVKLWDMGFIGVQLFFVLSGFLITRILLATQSATNYYGGFYARRALRIFPMFYGVLLIWSFVLPAIKPGATLLDGNFRYLVAFLSNWTQPFHPSGLGISHYWSLAVEEQFYLLWPLLIRRLRAVAVLRLCGVLAALSLLIRIAMVARGWPTEAVYEFTICRMDALALGGAVAAVMAIPGLPERLRRHPAWMRAAPLAVFVAGAAVSSLYRQTGPLPQTAGYSMLALAFALWVLSVAVFRGGGLPEQAPLLNRFLRGAGKYSYAAYLFHVPFWMVWERFVPSAAFVARYGVAGDLLVILAATLLIFGLAMLSYRFVEAPVLRWKHRFEPAFAPQVGAR